jgi:hypothetical protein
MKSVRLDDRLEANLRAAARASGVTESEFIRAAVEERSRQVLGDNLEERLNGVIGAVQARGGRARNASKHYTELLRRSKRKVAKRRS